MVELDKAALKPVHRVSDPAWVNSEYNEFGWLPDNRTLWFQSEESGYAHRIAQRLIELKKDHWELASYPLERHAFVQPESWYDEYRRIYQLFERTLK